MEVQEDRTSSEALVNNKQDRVYTQKPLRSCYIAGGYSHTCIVTEKDPVTFGLNIYGQLGTLNTNTSFEPKLLEKDEKGGKIKKIVKSACSTSGTFLISETGKLYTCGTGDSEVPFPFFLFSSKTKQMIYRIWMLFFHHIGASNKAAPEIGRIRARTPLT